MWTKHNNFDYSIAKKAPYPIIDYFKYTAQQHYIQER